jgi:hypothetical protein
LAFFFVAQRASVLTGAIFAEACGISATIPKHAWSAARPSCVTVWSLVGPQSGGDARCLGYDMKVDNGKVTTFRTGAALSLIAKRRINRQFPASQSFAL